mmetsp:Transcript_6761/g.11889  ORF Transcript_6761/g.11889 Transcript_6761/m.11889 type:complete len:232 (-) Transcript_6761:37-732(-)
MAVQPEDEESPMQDELPFGSIPGALMLRDWTEEPHVIQAQASFRLGCAVDILQLAGSLPNTEVNMEKMPNRVKLRGFRNPPRFTAIVTTGGSVSVTAAIDDIALHSLCKRIGRAIRKHYNPSVTFRGYKLVKMQVGASLAYAVDLQGLAEDVVGSSEVRVVHLQSSKKATIQVKDDEGDENVNIDVLHDRSIRVYQAGSLERTSRMLDILLPHLRRRRLFYDVKDARYKAA